MPKINLGVQQMYIIEISSIEIIGLRENANIHINLHYENIEIKRSI